MQIRTTLIIDDALLERAREMSGITGKTALLPAVLQALIAREAGRRLAALVGSEPRIGNIPRRRTKAKALAALLERGSVLMHPRAEYLPACDEHPLSSQPVHPAIRRP